MSYGTPAEFLTRAESLGIDLSTVVVTSSEAGSANTTRIQAFLDDATSEINASAPPVGMESRCKLAEFWLAMEAMYVVRGKELTSGMAALIKVQRDWLANLASTRTQTGTGPVTPEVPALGGWYSNDTVMSDNASRTLPASRGPQRWP